MDRYDISQLFDELPTAIINNDIDRIRSLTPSPDSMDFQYWLNVFLHIAVSWQNTQYLRVFLDASADPNYMNGIQTALHKSVMDTNTEISYLLIENGADRYSKNFEGYTPLDIATKQGHEEQIKVLLQAGADPHLTKYGLACLLTNPNFTKVCKQFRERKEMSNIHQRKEKRLEVISYYAKGSVQVFVI